MAMMVLLTFIIGLIAVKVRFASIKTGKVKARFYKLMAGQEVPKQVTVTTRCFNNQFEIPLLFYVVCTLYISLGIESSLAIISAWLFVALRYIHAYIHLSYNHVLHRMLVFWAGFIAVMVLWGNLVITQI